MAEEIKFPDTIIALLRDSQQVAVLTGAGISAESGVPTFRQAQTGLWAQFDPHQLATPEAFQSNPKLVWDWYYWRREIISAAKPNFGHIALVDLEEFYPEFTLITQNVDGLHQSAGSTTVIELHGNIFRAKCSQENRLFSELPVSTSVPPRCPYCEEFLRPDVVWFGEPLPEEALKNALKAVERCQVLISIGTSSLIEPAASLPFIAQARGARVLEINPETTPLTSSAYFSIRSRAAAVLSQLAAEIIN